LYTKILVAHDGSEGARAALKIGAALAAAPGAEMTVVEAIGGLDDPDELLVVLPMDVVNATDRRPVPD
jgi:nucleotide-binding universal stress UspA family protein